MRIPGAQKEPRKNPRHRNAGGLNGPLRTNCRATTLLSCLRQNVVRGGAEVLLQVVLAKLSLKRPHRDSKSVGRMRTVVTALLKRFCDGELLKLVHRHVGRQVFWRAAAL